MTLKKERGSNKGYTILADNENARSRGLKKMGDTYNVFIRWSDDEKPQDEMDYRDYRLSRRDTR